MRPKGRLAKPLQPKQAPKRERAPTPANLQQLEAGLREANAKLKDDSRAAAIAALEAVMKFLDSVPPLNAQNLATSLWALQAALKDLNHGRVVAMLAPTQKGRSRRPDPLIRKAAKAYAVFCVDILLREGSSTQEACRLVAKQLKGVGLAFGGRDTTPEWKRVKIWRDRVSKLPATDQMRETLEGLRMEMPRLKFRSLEDAKKRVAGRLRSLLEQEIGKPTLQ